MGAASYALWSESLGLWCYLDPVEIYSNITFFELLILNMFRCVFMLKCFFFFCRRTTIFFFLMIKELS